MSTPKFPTAEAVLRVARSQVGKTEHPPGSNETPYGAAYRMNGVAWCGIFVWWCFKEAGVDLHAAGIADPQYTPSFVREAERAGWKRIPDAEIRAGDVLFFDFVAPFNSSGIQHVAIATGRPSGGYVRTVEGNTSSGNQGSQDNGGGVFERTRSLSVIVAAVRPPWPVAAPASAPTAPLPVVKPHPKPAPAPKATSRRARTARRVVAATAAAGAVTAVGGAIAHGPTTSGDVVPAPTPRIPAPRPPATARPSVPVKLVPAPRATPTRVPRPPKRRATADERVITGPLAYGSTGNSVRILQRQLGLAADGVFGRRTLRKVRAVQAAADLVQDGVVGPVTARAIGLPYAPGNRP